MQILHECQDSGNDHFSQRCHRGHTSNKNNSSWQSNQHVESADNFGPVDASVILEHLKSITASTSENISQSKSTVEECLLHANLSGMFDIMPDPETSRNLSVDMKNKIKEVYQSDLELEELWKKEYENQQDQWKRKTVVASDSNKNYPLQPEQHNFQVREQTMSDGLDF